MEKKGNLILLSSFQPLLCPFLRSSVFIFFILVLSNPRFCSVPAVSCPPPLLLFHSFIYSNHLLCVFIVFPALIDYVWLLFLCQRLITGRWERESVCECVCGCLHRCIFQQGCIYKCIYVTLWVCRCLLEHSCVCVNACMHVPVVYIYLSSYKNLFTTSFFFLFFFKSVFTPTKTSPSFTPSLNKINK